MSRNTPANAKDPAMAYSVCLACTLNSAQERAWAYEQSRPEILCSRQGEALWLVRVLRATVKSDTRDYFAVRSCSALAAKEERDLAATANDVMLITSLVRIARAEKQGWVDRVTCARTYSSAGVAERVTTVGISRRSLVMARVQVHEQP